MITFKGKIRERRYVDGELAYHYIPVPKLGRHHCNMSAFRASERWGMFANSELFAGVLAKLTREIFPRGYIRLDSIPGGVEVDQSGFLAEVTIHLE